MGISYILSCASKAGSPKNHLGTLATRHGPVTLSVYILTDHLKIKKIRAKCRPVLLRQGEPGTPRYILNDVHLSLETQYYFLSAVYDLRGGYYIVLYKI